MRKGSLRYMQNSINDWLTKRAAPHFKASNPKACMAYCKTKHTEILSSLLYLAMAARYPKAAQFQPCCTTVLVAQSQTCGLEQLHYLFLCSTVPTSLSCSACGSVSGMWLRAATLLFPCSTVPPPHQYYNTCGSVSDTWLRTATLVSM